MKDGNQNQLVKSGEIEWKPLGEEGADGIYNKTLLFDDATGRAPTFLLKFDAGASYPLHNHPGGEEVFVLEGAVKFGKDELKTGDYLFTAAGNKHRVSTKTGCVLLLRVPQEVEIIKPRTLDAISVGV